MSDANPSLGLKGLSSARGRGGGGFWGPPGPGRSPGLWNKGGGGAFAGTLLKLSDFRA